MIKNITDRVRKLRKKQTISERIFWDRVRGNKLGKKFKRQHPLRFQNNGRQKLFITDFYCPSEKLVIEIDGPSHDSQEQYDELRSIIINNLGLRVIRFRNEEVMNSLDSVIQRLVNIINPLSVDEINGEGI